MAAAEDIFGLDVGSLKGKTVWQLPHKVPTTIIAVPILVLKQHWEVTLSIDVMFVNRAPMFITISHHLRFGMAKFILNCQPSTFISTCNMCLQYTGSMASSSRQSLLMENLN